MTAPTVRLHISPLTPSTAASIIPASATSVSFHTIETSPEKSYGFATLPAADAERLKKKLHGAMFRGVKASVTEARPEKRAGMHDDGGEEKRKRKKRKKVREEQGVVSGFQLPVGRQVKRGWEKEKCVVNVEVPENKRAAAKECKEKKKNTETKEERKARKKLRKQVKEFEKTKKFMGFLKESQLNDSKGKETLVGEYVDGVGWVNGEGKVVEKAKEEKAEKRRKKSIPEPRKEPSPEPEQAEESDIDMTVDRALQEPVQSLDAESESETETRTKPPPKVIKASKVAPAKEDAEPSIDEEEDESRSNSDLDFDSDSNDEEATTPAPKSKKTKQKAASSFSSTSSSEDHADDSPSSSDSDSEEATPKTPSSKPTLPRLEIHPLQAIYKPTALTTVSTGEETFKFGFGDGSDDEDESDDGDAPAPTYQTPYRDPLRYRSAAPTPDTAVGNKRFFSPEESAMQTSAPFTPIASKLGSFVPTTPQVAGGVSGDPLLFPHSESAFLHGMSIWSSLPTGFEDAEMWKAAFYENRGEWNRDWKRRRREAVKTNRRRERTRRPAAAV